MNGSNNLYNRGDTEDIVLDNYVAFLRHVRGERRLRVSSVRPREKTFPEKKCAGCGVMFSPERDGKNFCGSKAQRSGCTWLNIKEGVMKSMATRISHYPPKSVEDQKRYKREYWHKIGKHKRHEKNN